MRYLVLLSGLMIGLSALLSGCANNPGAEVPKETFKYDPKKDGEPKDIGPAGRGTGGGTSGKGKGKGGGGVKP
jgi:hypothetical protein